ncbi:aminotransferase class I/II-fold pyridoxal phosphate-dependent enzyme [Aceticella autotrophica]|uniref:Aminotransferase class I/II-fold pyridoxal phosphate-dependent enzyme n=1 Tax=Aceticella autotrophica TaxID=2755338 RepID=A0A975GAT4_9THEO|nr:aminotransferase class I/II-fold pyridoxal phosphate-dependent enzyme [Aceticella autotrophica]QSZ27417.1 aminotransferase class I/II-fold pyridoxal phosphate-dependent enzyme [Aceticella autotrophica]
MIVPLYDALKKYIDDGILPFHMPGHKGGRIISREYLKNIAMIDLTELPGTDNLHNPEGPILEAEKLAAKAFGAKESFFLVNGTTSGIYAAMAATLKKGDKVLIQRNSHKSIYSGLILTGAYPVYLSPMIDFDYEIAMGVLPEDVEKALKKDKDIKVVIITYPNYYGFCPDISRISEIVHRYNRILVVDEAHGAHFAFSDKLPITSLEAGADIAVQSIHKTLPAFTQSSILHVGSDRIDIDRLKFSLRLFQTTSPSYILMSSIDMARAYMEEKGNKRLDSVIDLCNYIRDEINNIEGIKCHGKDIIGRYGIKDLDVTKLAINVSGLRLTGLEAEKILRDKFKIQMEMADLYNILAIITVADGEEEINILLKAIRSLRNYKGETDIIKIDDFCDCPEIVIMPAEVFQFRKNMVSLDNAEGKISGDFIIPYPPGIPIICPGERIKKGMVKYISLLYNKGIRIIGVKDFKIKVCENV